VNAPEYAFDVIPKLTPLISESGPYYNWNRWYFPGEGRYGSSDPVLSAFPSLGLPRNALAYFVYDPGALAPFGYARQSPAGFSDFSGLFPCWKKPVGAKCVCTFGGEHLGTETVRDPIEWSPPSDVPRVDQEGILIPEGQRATICGEKCQAELDRLRGTVP
jgi:uncharacterized protein RhaS with RHS repeats